MFDFDYDKEFNQFTAEYRNYQGVIAIEEDKFAGISALVYVNDLIYKENIPDNFKHLVVHIIPIFQQISTLTQSIEKYDELLKENTNVNDILNVKNMLTKQLNFIKSIKP